MKINKKENRGGARPNSGRKKGTETGTISIRHDKKTLDEIRAKYSRGDISKLGKQWLDSLLK